MEVWLQSLRDADKTCIIDKGIKKVHYKFSDGREMVEEWNTETGTVSNRSWKVQKHIGSEPEWEVELGDPSLDLKNAGDIKEACDAPIVSTRNTRHNLEWRIRNLPYPIETYSVTVEREQRVIVVRTSNKKFFKKLSAPDLDRLCLPIEQSFLSYEHKFNTLIISYKKPAEISLCEKLWLEEINRLPKEKVVDFKGQDDSNNVQCPTS